MAQGGPGRRSGQCREEACLGHGQRGQLAVDGPIQSAGGLAPLCRELFSFLRQSNGGALEGALGLDELEKGDPDEDRWASVLDHVSPAERLVLGGYSFGADVALSLDDERIERWICSAPVLHVFDDFAAANDPRPKHLIAGAHDQFRSADALREATRSWPATDVAEIATADHFFGGSHATITVRVTELLGG